MIVILQIVALLLCTVTLSKSNLFAFGIQVPLDAQSCEAEQLDAAQSRARLIHEMTCKWPRAYGLVSAVSDCVNGHQLFQEHSDEAKNWTQQGCVGCVETDLACDSSTSTSSKPKVTKTKTTTKMVTPVNFVLVTVTASTTGSPPGNGFLETTDLFAATPVIPLLSAFSASNPGTASSATTSSAGIASSTCSFEDI